MGHLINPITNCKIDDAILRLNEALEYLRTCVEKSLTLMEIGLEKVSWATTLKRIKVKLPNEKKPTDIGAESEHNFIEVLNQVATTTRLRDALDWCKWNTEINFCKVIKCHPTTSSERTNVEDNDLILQFGEGEKAYFEVSDIVSSGDGNGKLIKDLCSLQAIEVEKNKFRRVGKRLGVKRLFLVVSSEFSQYIMKSQVAVKEHVKFEEKVFDAKNPLGTHLIEVMKLP